MNQKVAQLVCLNLFLVLVGLVQAQGGEEKAILDVAPTLAELGEEWTTNVVAYLLDPRSRPSEIDYHRDDPKSSPVLDFHRKQMAADGRTGYGMIWREDCMFQEFTFRRGLFHVCIEAGHGFDYRALARVAEVIDTKIRGKRDLE